MNTGMMDKTLLLTALLTAIAFSSCAPQSSNQNSPYQDSNVTDASSANIVGGVLADSNFQKQNGVVQLKITSSQGTSTCTGSLIAPNLVLTAAHCVEDSKIKRIQVIFGLTDTNIKKGSIVLAAAWSNTQTYYKPLAQNESHNDIALVKLNQNAPADFNIAKLPTSTTVADLKASAKLTFAGFGMTNAMVNKLVKDSSGNIFIMPLPSAGVGTLRKVDNIVVTAIRSDQKEILLDQSNGKGACHGDSGGPAFLKLADGSNLLVGVTSRSTEQLGNCTQGVIYTSVVGQLGWIKTESQKLLQPETAATSTAVAAK